VLLFDQAQVVDPGRRRRRRRGVVGAGLAVHVSADLVWHRGTHCPAMPADLDVGEVERVEDQLEPTWVQERLLI